MLRLETVPGRLPKLHFQNIYCTVCQPKVSPPRKCKLLFFFFLVKKMSQDSLLDSSTVEGVHSLHFNILNKRDNVRVQ